MALMRGDLAGATDEALGAVGEDPLGANSALAASCAGRAALWLRDAARARTALERTRFPDGGWQVAARRGLEAGIDALEGRRSEAASVYDGLLAGRLAAGDRFTHALITLDAVAVLPAELVPQGVVETARAFLEELGAEPLLARLVGVDAPS
jgi:hypothetical protein